MDTAAKIGLLHGFGWIAGLGIIMTPLVCWGLTPVGHWLVMIVGETGWDRVLHENLYKSFFPGDVFLGTTAAALLIMAKWLPVTEAWYNSAWWHRSVFTSTMLVAVAAMIKDRMDGLPLRALLSPSHVYHHFLLIGGFGYVVVTTFVAVALGSQWSLRFALLLILCLLPAMVWGYYLWDEQSAPQDVAQARLIAAHRTDWEPIWAPGWRYLELWLTRLW